MGEARQRKLAKAAGRPWPQDAGLPFQGIDRPRGFSVVSPWNSMTEQQILDQIAGALRIVNEPPVLVHQEPPPRVMPMPKLDPIGIVGRRRRPMDALLLLVASGFLDVPRGPRGGVR